MREPAGRGKASLALCVNVFAFGLREQHSVSFAHYFRLTNTCVRVYNMYNVAAVRATVPRDV